MPHLQVVIMLLFGHTNTSKVKERKPQLNLAIIALNCVWKIVYMEYRRFLQNRDRKDIANFEFLAAIK